MAESDEYWSYLMAGAYALVGETDQALGWLEHTVKTRGWVDYGTSPGTTGSWRACARPRGSGS